MMEPVWLDYMPRRHHQRLSEEELAVVVRIIPDSCWFSIHDPLPLPLMFPAHDMPTVLWCAMMMMQHGVLTAVVQPSKAHTWQILIPMRAMPVLRMAAVISRLVRC